MALPLDGLGWACAQLGDCAIGLKRAGADVLFAPGARTKEDLRAIVAAVAPKPVNALVGANLGLTVAVEVCPPA